MASAATVSVSSLMASRLSDSHYPVGEAKPFRQVALELFRDREDVLTQTGNVNWMKVAELLPDVYYETLRKAVAGDRIPTPDLMEKVAAEAGVEPTAFAEYQLHLARRQFDVKEVGLETAMRNLRAWAAGSTERPKKRR